MEKKECSKYTDKITRLRGLVEVSTAIISTMGIKDLLRLIMDISTDVMHAEASSLMLLDGTKNKLVYEVALGEKGEQIKESFSLDIGQGIAGWVAEQKELLNVPDVKKDSRFYNEPDNVTGFKTRAVICVPLMIKDRLIGVLEAINPKRRMFFSDDDGDIFTAFASQAAVAIENARMQEMIIQQKVIEHELSIAREIQQNFLHQEIPRMKGFDIAAKTIPAYKIGGDFFDVFILDDKRVGVVVGDVSGKGIPAALYMVKTLTSLRAKMAECREPQRIFESLNRTLFRESTLGMFVTMILTVFDASSNTITVVNAGHVPAIQYYADQKNSEIILKQHGPPLGIIADVHYDAYNIPFHEKDVLVLYTDGVIEAQDPQGNYLSYKELKKMIEVGHHGNSEEILSGIIGSVREKTQSNEFNDDLTLAVIKRKQT